MEAIRMKNCEIKHEIENLLESNENDDLNVYENFIRSIQINSVSELDREIEMSIRDCSQIRRYCMHNQDCETICEPHTGVLFRCDENEICYPWFIEDNEDPNKVECDTKSGEYALLVGYTTVGTALWQCVQLYQQYVDRNKYCENGDFQMNVDLREPSYRDCTCSGNDIRAIYKIASAYDNALPHCISENNWRFYELDMIRI